MLRGIKRLAGDAARKFMAARGYSILPRELTARTMEDTFGMLRRHGHEFKTVIDIGASDGRWSGSLMAYFPDCNFLMIEAQATHKPALDQFCAAHPRASWVHAAAGERPGTLFFDATDPLGGQASYSPFAIGNIEVPVVSIDDEIAARRLVGPYLIKLDTHGFEIPILSGASEVLKQASVAIIECYNFRIAPECLLFHQMCVHMEQLGFRCIDLVDTVNRRLDGAFWQMDLVFVRANRQEFARSTYD